MYMHTCNSTSWISVCLSFQLISLSQRVLGRRLFNWFMKRTLYGQFVAGEDLESVHPVISRYRASGIRSILDYAVEEDIGNQEVEMETRQVEN